MSDDSLKYIVKAVTQEIVQHRILMVWKIKHGSGKQLVSVGLMKFAVPRSLDWYAVLAKEDRLLTVDPYAAAKNFVAFVGRPLARAAVREIRERHKHG